MFISLFNRGGATPTPQTPIPPINGAFSVQSGRELLNPMAGEVRPMDRELIQRMTRIETRLVKLMRVFGLDANGDPSPGHDV